jgi:hypothetical protein
VLSFGNQILKRDQHWYFWLDKASTGYTFKNSDKKSSELVAFLQRETDFTKFHKRPNSGL